MKIDKIEISLKNGKSVFQYAFNNDNGIEVKILTLGGIIADIMVQILGVLRKYSSWMEGYK